MEQFEQRKKIYSASAALFSAITLGCLQQGKLGNGLFSIQLTLTFIIASWIPYMYHIDLSEKIPFKISVSLTSIWLFTCFGPVFVALVIELFTGHRKPDSTVFDALWRVYAILGLWILIAVVMERVIRPYWKKNSDKFLGGIRQYSVAGNARKIAIERRSKTLEAIKARVVQHRNKRTSTLQTIENKKQEIEKAKQNVEKTSQMLEKAENKAQTCDQDEKQEAKEMVKSMQDLLKSSIEYEKGLHSDIARMKLDIEQLDIDIDQLKQEYTEALHINNYTGFYR